MMKRVTWNNAIQYHQACERHLQPLPLGSVKRTGPPMLPMLLLSGGLCMVVSWHLFGTR